MIKTHCKDKICVFNIFLSCGIDLKLKECQSEPIMVQVAEASVLVRVLDQQDLFKNAELGSLRLGSDFSAENPTLYLLSWQGLVLSGGIGRN